MDAAKESPGHQGIVLILPLQEVLELTSFFPSKHKFNAKIFHLEKIVECKMSDFTLLPQHRKFNKVIFSKIMYFY